MTYKVHIIDLKTSHSL